MKTGAILIAAFALVIGGYFALQNTASPPKPKTTSSGASSPVIIVLQSPLTGAAIAGELIYNERCSACHGINAAGQNDIGPPLIHQIYQPSRHDDSVLLWAAQNGVLAHHWDFGNMPPIAGVTKEDARKIAAYIRALQRQSGIN